MTGKFKQESTLAMSNDNTVHSKNKRGRPKSPDELVRSERVVTFLTKSEFAKISESAEKNDQSISAVAHRLLAQSINQLG